MGNNQVALRAVKGFHCPLTPLARRLGDPTGSVTDIYLPRWFAHNLPAIHVPLLVLAIALHRRNFRNQHRKPKNSLMPRLNMIPPRKMPEQPVNLGRS